MEQTSEGDKTLSYSILFLSPYPPVSQVLFVRALTWFDILCSVTWLKISG